MKLSLGLTSLLPILCTAIVHDNDQQAITGQQHAEQYHSNTKLSDVIAASPLLCLHRAICEIESVTDDEFAVGELLVSILEAHNFTVKTQSVPPPNSNNSTKGRFNVYAYPDVSKYSSLGASSIEGEHVTTKPKVLLSSHIDTVPPHIPYSLSLPKPESKSSRKDILISGRGTVDDKACVAVQLQTALDLLSSGGVSPSDVALLFVVGEEKRGDGMRAFSDSKLYKATNSGYKAILFGEPTEGKLAAGHKGIEMLTLKARGKAAHSGYPWLGRSANSMILPALTVLDALGDIPEAEGGLPRSDKYGKSTVNVGYMQGGVAGNVVPEYATADITFRLAGGTVSEVREIVTHAVRKVDPEGLLELEFSQGYGPVPLDADVTGFDTITVNYGTDVPNIEVKEGVKRYLYGPGSILVAHGKDEGLTVGDMEEALAGYKRLVKHALEL
ncbi:acetylornithine deacetylase [Cladophialophora yegresii CBS 114405]|uniref:Acetylornithine deacetylase n=1 Tax=Cladophialophora yegresii CBS 114405 TaxID=1182544 RepID=W9WBD0_9EURO|nr:acetylornithine deacetylase [Cladophialophora yegresii CBS 114405]EXJ65402.1 acetylornithine deacetylase [Cladophialophora yegresii CBS 114405]